MLAPTTRIYFGVSCTADETRFINIKCSLTTRTIFFHEKTNADNKRILIPTSRLN